MRWLALAALVACAKPASCPPPRAGLPADPRPFLWEVDGKLVLFGTFHAGGKSDIPAAAIARLHAARLLVTEIPPLEPDKVQPLLWLPRGQSLPELVGDDAWYDLREALTGRINEEDLRRARPWYAMSLLTSAMVDTPSPSMDEAVAAEAKQARREHLETGEEQLATLGESVTAEDLKQAIGERKLMHCSVDELTAAYRRGDGEAIRGELSGDAETKLLDERNQRWLAKLEGYLSGEGVFVAVGVSHLVGDRGLPALLEARGHRVTRIQQR